MTLENQPPYELLISALEKQGVSLEQDGIYRIDDEIRYWVEEKYILECAAS